MSPERIELSVDWNSLDILQRARLAEKAEGLRQYTREELASATKQELHVYLSLRGLAVWVLDDRSILRARALAVFDEMNPKPKEPEHANIVNALEGITSHLTAREAEKLNNPRLCSDKPPVRVEDNGEYGWFFFVPLELEDFDESWDEEARLAWPGLYALSVYARQAKAPLIWLDLDADEIDGLETYSW